MRMPRGYCSCRWHPRILATEILCWTNTFSTVLSRAIVNLTQPPVRNSILLLYKTSVKTHEAGLWYPGQGSQSYLSLSHSCGHLLLSDFKVVLCKRDYVRKTLSRLVNFEVVLHRGEKLKVIFDSFFSWIPQLPPNPPIQAPSAGKSPSSLQNLYPSFLFFTHLPTSFICEHYWFCS